MYASEAKTNGSELPSLRCRTEGRSKTGPQIQAGMGDPIFLNLHRRPRGRALSDLATDSKLHGCDIVRPKIGNLVMRGCPEQDGHPCAPNDKEDSHGIECSGLADRR
jgi:hypothetical protein